ncbi:MAG: RrF2 family transcriptional regulator [Gemmataceae bacterium]
MALLSRKTDYALLILQYLHQKAEGGCAREIADRFELSRAFVANILKELCQKDFVESHRGVKGGYVLARPAEEINLAELIETLDDSFRLAECNQPSPDDGCSVFHLCPLKGPMAEIHRRIREVLSNLSLADLFDWHGELSPELLHLTLPDPCALPAAPEIEVGA